MSTGFDSMVQWQNGLTYSTKGPLYARYSNKHSTVVDGGYPKRLDSGEWGKQQQQQQQKPLFRHDGVKKLHSLWGRV